MAEQSDAELIVASLGRPEAFRGIFDRHFATIHRYLVRRVGRDGADELASDAFLLAFSSRERFDPAADSARPWLFGIATRLVSRWYRSAERRDRAYERALGSASTSPIDVFARVDDRCDAHAEAQRLGAALDALADADRDTLLLFAWEHLSYEEIAIALDIPVGTVRSRLFRARRIIRELVEPCGQLQSDPTEGGTRG